MAWITPKTDWDVNDEPMPSDFNRTEGNIDYLNDVKAERDSLTGILLSTGWSGTSAPYTQTITVSGITATPRVWIDVNISGASDYDEEQELINNFNLVYRIVQGTNQITAYAKDEPEINLPLVIEVVK